MMGERTPRVVKFSLEPQIVGGVLVTETHEHQTLDARVVTHVIISNHANMEDAVAALTNHVAES